MDFKTYSVVTYPLFKTLDITFWPQADRTMVFRASLQFKRYYFNLAIFFITFDIINIVLSVHCPSWLDIFSYTPWLVEHNKIGDWTNVNLDIQLNDMLHMYSCSSYPVACDSFLCQCSGIKNVELIFLRVISMQCASWVGYKSKLLFKRFKINQYWCCIPNSIHRSFQLWWRGTYFKAYSSLSGYYKLDRFYLVWWSLTAGIILDTWDSFPCVLLSFLLLFPLFQIISKLMMLSQNEGKQNLNQNQIGTTKWLYWYLLTTLSSSC